MAKPIMGKKPSPGKSAVAVKSGVTRKIKAPGTKVSLINRSV